MLKIPFFALAPMANITTYPFASQCYAYDADLIWTPMVHTDTVLNNWPEAEKILNLKEVDQYIIQLVGSNPDKFSEAIKLIELKGSDPINGFNLPLGYDLNAGCPDKNIIKSGCGGCLMKDTQKIIEIVRAMKSATERPVSVKTRAGFDNLIDIYDLAKRLQNEEIWLLTVHPRTVKQGYTGAAEWKVIKRLKKEMNYGNQSIKIAGSGDIQTWEEALRRQQETGCDGILIGRGALGKPWIFKEIKTKRDFSMNLSEIKTLVLDLAGKAAEIWDDHGIKESRKHFAWYFKGFEGAKELRVKLMQAETLADVREVLKN